MEYNWPLQASLVRTLVYYNNSKKTRPVSIPYINHRARTRNTTNKPAETGRRQDAPPPLQEKHADWSALTGRLPWRCRRRLLLLLVAPPPPVEASLTGRRWSATAGIRWTPSIPDSTRSSAPAARRRLQPQLVLIHHRISACIFTYQ